MRKLFSTKRRIVATVLSVGLVAGAAGAAFAFFETTGSSTGTGSIGSVGTWTVTGPVITGGPLYPGQGSETVSSATIQNTGAHGQQGLVAITVQITSASAGCTVADFSLAESANWVLSTTTNTNDTATYTPASPVDIAPTHYFVGGADSASTGNALPSGLSLSYADTSSNQTPCAGGTVTLKVSAS